jgi:hypothetical protein
MKKHKGVGCGLWSARESDAAGFVSKPADDYCGCGCESEPALDLQAVRDYLCMHGF